MAKFPVLERQVEPSSITSSVKVTSDSMGAGVGKAISQLGATVGDYAANLKDQKQKAEMIEADKFFLDQMKIQLKIENVARQAADNLDNYADEKGKLLEQEWSTSLANQGYSEETRNALQKRYINQIAMPAYRRNISFEHTERTTRSVQQALENENEEINMVREQPELYDQLYAGV